MQRLREARMRLDTLPLDSTPLLDESESVASPDLRSPVGDAHARGPRHLTSPPEASVQQRRRMDNGLSPPPDELLLDLANLPHADHIDAERRRLQAHRVMTEQAACVGGGTPVTLSLALAEATKAPSDCSGSYYGHSVLNAVERDEWVWAASDHNPYHMSVYANQIASPKQLDPPTGSPKGDAATLLPAPAIALPKQPPHAPGPRPQL